MKNRIKLSSAIFFILLSIPSLGLNLTKSIVPGVNLTQIIRTAPQEPQIINIISIDLTNPSISIKLGLSKDAVYVDDYSKGRESISSITKRKGALVGINADYFPMNWGGDPLGIGIMDGELISEARGNRAAIAFPSNGTPFIDIPVSTAKITLANGVTHTIDGINKTRETGQLIAYTKAFGLTTQSKFKAYDVVLSSSDLPIKIGKTIKASVVQLLPDSLNNTIPEGNFLLSGGGAVGQWLKENLKAGDLVTLNFDVCSPNCLDWSKVNTAIGGGPWLVKDNRVFIDNAEEGFARIFATGLNPRSAAGITADNKLMLVTVDGRQAMSKGMSLGSLASLMKELGCINALNLDGGGSTALSVAGLIINSPSENIERLVADALLVYSKDMPSVSNQAVISANNDKSLSSQPVQMSLRNSDQSYVLQDKILQGVWGSVGGIGFIDQQGLFYPALAKKGTIGWFSKDGLSSKEMEVLPGYTADIRIKGTQDAPDSIRYTIIITAKDSYGNLVRDADVVLSATGGVLEQENCKTDMKGQMVTGICWDGTSPEITVKAVIEGVSSVIKIKALKQPTSTP